MNKILVKQVDKGFIEQEFEYLTLDGCPLSETFGKWVGIDKKVKITVELLNLPKTVGVEENR